MKKFISLFVLIAVLFVAPAWAANERAKTDRSTKTHTLLVEDEASGEIRKLLSTTNGLKVDASAGGGGVVDQGISGVSDADPWNMMIRNGTGTELGLAASPFAISIFDAASNLLGVTANPFVVDLGVNNDVVIQATAASPGSVRLSDGTAFYKATTPSDTQPISAVALPLPTGAATEATLSSLNGTDFSTETTLAAMNTKIPASPSTDRSTAVAPFSTRLSDGTVFYKATTPSDTQPISAASLPLPSGAATEATLAGIKTGTDKIIVAPSTEAKQDDNITQVTAIELNTDSPTTPAFGTVSVTTTATSILAADPNRRSALIRNADSNTVLFLGFTSGVTTANGLPVGTAGASGATGNGGTVIYSHTGAIWGIVASGTADVRFQTESD